MGLSGWFEIHSRGRIMVGRQDVKVKQKNIRKITKYLQINDHEAAVYQNV